MANTTSAGHLTASGIVDALNHEWRRMERDHAWVVTGWAHRHVVLASCESLDQVLQAAHDDSDGVLHALLGESGQGDQIAGRVVLQSMVGRMVRMAHRDVKAGVDDYVAALWCEISTYPLTRRPVRIAANLALDTLKAVQREHRWVVRGQVTTWPPGEWLDELFDSARGDTRLAGDQVGCDPDAPAVIAAAHQLELIDDTARRILTSVYVDGLSGAEAAVRHATSPGSIRVRCSRAVGRLSHHAAALAEAA